MTTPSKPSPTDDLDFAVNGRPIVISEDKREPCPIKGCRQLGVNHMDAFRDSEGKPVGPMSTLPYRDSTIWAALCEKHYAEQLRANREIKKQAAAARPKS